MSADEAYAAFKAVRFADNGGEPVCPRCGCDACYTYSSRRIFKCPKCEDGKSQFSVTSGTMFASRKLPVKTILLAVALFVNGVNGFSALRLSRDLCCDYKTAFVLLHKLRELMGEMRVDRKLTGLVEVDGADFGGKRRKTQYVADRVDWSKLPRHPKRKAVVTFREKRRGGRTLSFACRHESEAVAAVLAYISPTARVRSDEASHWLFPSELFAEWKMINHSQVGFSHEFVNTNLVESFHARMRKAERGIHGHIAGPHLQGYADEIAWREDHRRISNGAQSVLVVRAGSKARPSRLWAGYWQRGPGARESRLPAA